MEEMSKYIDSCLGTLSETDRDIYLSINDKGINSHLHAGKNHTIHIPNANKILTIGSSILKYKIMT